MVFHDAQHRKQSLMKLKIYSSLGEILKNHFDIWHQLSFLCVDKHQVLLKQMSSIFLSQIFDE